jgi:hypothetical protein
VGQKKPPKYRIPSPPLKPSTPEKPVNRPVSLSFKLHREGEKYCLSHCEKDEIKAYLKALRLLTTMSWMEVIKTGGKPYGGKVSLGYTKYDDLTFEEVSPDIPISGLRADGEMRFFGYHLDQVYYIVRFDPRHDIVPARH